MIINPYRADPKSVAPQQWCDPEMPSTLFQTGTRGAEGSAVAAHGDSIGLVLDRSGNNIDFVQGTAGSRPLYGIGPRRYFDFDGSADYFENLSPGIPTTGYPWSFGCWFSPDVIGANSHLIMLVNWTTAGHRMTIRLNTSNTIDCITNNNTSAGTATTTGTIAVGNWYYVVARWIDATNRRMSVLFPNGTIEHVQNTTSRAPTGMDRLGMGCEYKNAPATFFNGKIGEAWVADSDIQADGLQLSNTTLLQLAYGGPAL